jgi:hypothetical protein
MRSQSLKKVSRQQQHGQHHTSISSHGVSPPRGAELPLAAQLSAPAAPNGNTARTESRFASSSAATWSLNGPITLSSADAFTSSSSHVLSLIGYLHAHQSLHPCTPCRHAPLPLDEVLPACTAERCGPTANDRLHDEFFLRGRIAAAHGPEAFVVARTVQVRQVYAVRSGWLRTCSAISTHCACCGTCTPGTETCGSSSCRARERRSGGPRTTGAAIPRSCARHQPGARPVACALTSCTLEGW